MLQFPPKHSFRISFAVVIAMAVWTCASLAQTAAAPPDAATEPRRDDSSRQLPDESPGGCPELHNNPSLVNDPTWLAKHPDLHNYMNNHPGLQKAAAANPASVVNRADRSTLGRDHADLNKTDSYLSHHPEIRQELSKNPKLIDDPEIPGDASRTRQGTGGPPRDSEQAMNHPEDFKKAAKANSQYNKNQAKKK